MRSAPFVTLLLWVQRATLGYCQHVCSSDFEIISASDYVASLSPGWNLGNTLDAFPNEDSWNNPSVTEATFGDVRDFGFNSVRIPITWAYHFAGSSNQGDSPEWTIDPFWLQRVADVVDMATSYDLHVLVNVHHDSRLWADLTAPSVNYTMIEEKFYRLWYQIGSKLACSSALVAFEPLNEAPGETADIAEQLNKLNNIFLQAINDAGGFNPQRFVTLSGPGQDIFRTSLWFQRPDPKYNNPWAIQVHYYGPYDFTSAAWGKTIWGNDEDLAVLEHDFAQLRNNFTDVPVVVGEWLVSPLHSEPAARWRYYDFLGRMCHKYGFVPYIWDTGNDHLDRDAHAWRDSAGLHVHFNALLGNANSLPESTVDTSATSQFSSAFVFHKAGDIVEDTRLSFSLNGNSVQSISDSSVELREGIGYVVDGSEIILPSSFLSHYFEGTEATGLKATLIVAFTQGPSIPLQLVQWDTPGFPISSAQPGTDGNLELAVNWNGLGKPATLAAFKPDDTPLIDEWTRVLPPLQRGRTTFGGSWNWNWGQQSITITGNAISAAVQSEQSITFMIEAYPRVPGNHANFTVFK